MDSTAAQRRPVYRNSVFLRMASPSADGSSPKEAHATPAPEVSPARDPVEASSVGDCPCHVQIVGRSIPSHGVSSSTPSKFIVSMTTENAKVDASKLLGLNEDEVIIWESVPSPHRHLHTQDFLLIPMGLFFAGFTAVGAFVVVPRFGGGSQLLFFTFSGLVAAYLLIGRFFIDGLAQSWTRYVVTNRRAFVVSRDSVAQQQPASRGQLDLFESFSLKYATITLGGRKLSELIDDDSPRLNHPGIGSAWLFESPGMQLLASFGRNKLIPDLPVRFIDVPIDEARRLESLVKNLPA